MLVVGFALFYLISHSGAGSNAQALQQAKQLYRQGHRKEALELLEREGDPSRADEYVSVDEQIKTWRSETAHEGDDLKSQAAMDIYKKIDFDRIEQWKNHLTDAQLGQRLLNLAEEYKGTLQVMELLNSQNQPYPKLRDAHGEAKARQIGRFAQRELHVLRSGLIGRSPLRLPIGSKIRAARNFHGSGSRVATERRTSTTPAIRSPWPNATRCDSEGSPAAAAPLDAWPASSIPLGDRLRRSAPRPAPGRTQDRRLRNRCASACRSPAASRASPRRALASSDPTGRRPPTVACIRGTPDRRTRHSGLGSSK